MFPWIVGVRHAMPNTYVSAYRAGAPLLHTRAAMERMRPHRLFALLLAALLWPVAVWAATPAAQDYQEAIASTPDPQRGARLYVTCAGCHRENGSGNIDGSVPLIAGQHPRVLMRQLADYRHARRWDARMQHYSDTHVLADPQAIADVAAYVATLEFRGRNGTGNGKLVSIGRSLFAMHCAACHGKSGEGNAGDAVPRVAGQHFAYLLGQFHEARAGSRRAFTAEHVQMLQGLDDDQLTGLADALSRMN